MKKTILSIILSVMTFAAIAQENTIKFLGIPIDGTKKEMISKLQAKGYEYDPSSDALYGEFNGNNVIILVQTVNNRVWRIVVADAEVTDEANIKIRFNRLFEQLSNNGKYDVAKGNILGEKENIFYEMIGHKKRYDATFTLKDKSVNGIVWFTIARESNEYAIAMYYENLDNQANGDDL